MLAALTNGDIKELAAVLDEVPALAIGKGPHGRTLLHGVASRGNVDAARVFLEHGANIDATDEQGATPLVMAVLGKQAAMVHYLLDAGADPTIKLNIEGNPMAENFASSEQRDIYDTIKKATLRKSDPMMAWIQAVGRADAAEMKSILVLHPEYGSSPYPGKGWPLFMAVATGKREAVLLLLDAHAPVDSQEVNGSTPLSLSVTSENADIANLLIDRGADPNTVLALAAGECKIGMLQLLLDRGADVNHRDGKATALDHALLAGQDECIKLLKRSGGKRGKDL
jgi:ankyrin repeat protein